MPGEAMLAVRARPEALVQVAAAQVQPGASRISLAVHTRVQGAASIIKLAKNLLGPFTSLNHHF